MYFKPFTPAKHYVMPCFIIHASDRFVVIRTELGDETITRLDIWQTSKRVIYSCVELSTLTLYGDESLWMIRTWNGQVSRMQYGETVILPLTVNGWDQSLADFFESLWTIWGIAAASLNTMVTNLWRTTLLAPVSFIETAPTLLGPIAVGIGGRKEANRGTFRDQAEYDISAAYPHAMTALIPQRLTLLEESQLRTLDVTEWEGIAVARVRIPPYRWGPIPLPLNGGEDSMKSNGGISSYGHTGNGYRTVTLPIRELDMIRRIGGDVHYLTGSVAPANADAPSYFTRWVAEILPWLRSLPGLSGGLGKTLAARLWSVFAVGSEGLRSEHRWINGHRVTTALGMDTASRREYRESAHYVGAIISSRVRQRVYLEGLLHFKDICYVDTDGVIAVEGQEPMPGWRVKTDMRTIEIAAEQCYRYSCHLCIQAPYGHQGPHLVVAGASSREAKSRMFREMHNAGILVTSFATTFPNQGVTDEPWTQAEIHRPLPFGFTA